MLIPTGKIEKLQKFENQQSPPPGVHYTGVYLEVEVVRYSPEKELVKYGGRVSKKWHKE